MTSLCIFHPQSVSLSPLYTFIVRESLYLQRAQNVLYICILVVRSTILALSCTTRRITPFYFVITTLCTLIYCSMLDGGFFVKLQTAFSVLLPDFIFRRCVFFLRPRIRNLGLSHEKVPSHTSWESLCSKLSIKCSARCITPKSTG